MNYKKNKASIKEFTNFASLSLKDLKKVEMYFYSNLEAIKNRENELLDIENQNIRIRKTIEDQKNKYFEYKSKYIQPINNYINEAKIFLNHQKLPYLSISSLLGNSLKYGKGHYQNNENVKKVIFEINRQTTILKKYEEENPYKNYFQLKEIKKILPSLDKKLFRFGGVSHYVIFKSIKIDLIKEYIQKIHEVDSERKKKLDDLKARGAYNDVETRKIAESFKRKYPLVRQLEKLSDCPYCNQILDKKRSHLEHIYPVSKGGKSSSKNLVWICSTCNIKKGNKTLISFIKIHKMNRDSIEFNLDWLEKEY